MRKILFSTIILLTINVWMALAQTSQQNRAQIMVLGSYHMHNPGADVFNVAAEDVFKPHRQQEILQVVEQLKSFDPSMVALEIKRGTKRDSLEQANYNAYLQGNYELTRWEGHQIGFRVAKELGHPAIYNIDEPGDFPFEQMMDWAQENDQQQWIDATMAKMTKRMKDEESAMTNKSIGAQLLEMNRPSAIKEGHSVYVAGCQIGAGEAFPGTDVLTSWYQRNARIFTNLYRLTEGKKTEKILVIFGAGHAYILRELIRLAPEFELVEPSAFLSPSGTEQAFEPLLRSHLDAVVNKDSLALKSTLNMEGSYHLILPDGTQMHTAKDFYNMHVDWFKGEKWTMEMKILGSENYGNVGKAFVQADYREPDRNGQPYHHKMWITYLCEKIGGKWKVVHDHCSTAEKTH